MNSNSPKDDQDVSAEQTAPSFFDGMEDLETSEVIGMAILDKIKPLAPEYSSEEISALKRMLESKGKKEDS